MENQKLEAIKAAMGQIEKQFGKGSIMKLGDSGKDDHRCHPNRSYGFGSRPWSWRSTKGESSKFLVPRVVEKLLWRCMLLKKPRKKVELRLLLTRNMLLILHGQPVSGWISKNF